MRTHTLFTAGIVLLLSASAFSQNNRERKLYVGSDSTEAKMTYTTTVEVPYAQSINDYEVSEAIESQIEHSIGPMSAAEYMSVPKGDQRISNVKEVSNKNGVMTVQYTYKGTIVLRNGPTTSYDVVMPINPYTIYEAAMVGNHNPCTDHHYQSEGDFWYFWNPYQSGCKLKEGRDYQVVKTKIERIKNTKISYPEYHNLPDARGITSVHMFFGLDEATSGRDPLTSKDINAELFVDFRDYLIKNGYKGKKMTAAAIKKIAKTMDGKAPYVETFTKGKIEYQLFFGATGIDEDALAFHWFYKNALENASIMLYGGHSGLGGHLDLESIEANIGTKIKFSKRYQIYFFDSCTSYKYYNAQYFDRKVTATDKNGTKKLDIFTNGLATYFDAMPASNRAIAQALEKALNYASKKTYVSYQTLAKQIDSDNLFGVNGDEDNEAPKK